MREFLLKKRGIVYRTNELRPERPTLLFVHGLSGSSSAWRPFEERFENDFNVVTLDLRGHGFSVRPRNKSGYAMQEFVEDLRALLEEVNVERCTLISHSFGTLIAAEFAKAHPARVERAVFIAPAYQMRRFALTRALAQAAAALALFPLRILPYGRTDYSSFRATPDYSPLRIFLDIAHMGARSYLLCMRTIFARDYDPDWKVLAMPALILHGARDTIVPFSHAEALARTLPQGTLEQIEGNHILVINNIDEVADQIEKFVAQ